mmetsp:Transcript_643/g.1360  ORF Transcript_643/g.1360 Transcript_643/m.1360 type:complete len:412 (+) Transcript_643:840-2075(+)
MEAKGPLHRILNLTDGFGSLVLVHLSQPLGVDQPRRLHDRSDHLDGQAAQVELRHELHPPLPRHRGSEGRLIGLPPPLCKLESLLHHPPDARPSEVGMHASLHHLDSGLELDSPQGCLVDARDAMRRVILASSRNFASLALGDLAELKGRHDARVCDAVLQKPLADTPHGVQLRQQPQLPTVSTGALRPCPPGVDPLEKAPDGLEGDAGGDADGALPLLHHARAEHATKLLARRAQHPAVGRDVADAVVKDKLHVAVLRLREALLEHVEAPRVGLGPVALVVLLEALDVGLGQFGFVHLALGLVASLLVLVIEHVLELHDLHLENPDLLLHSRLLAAQVARQLLAPPLGPHNRTAEVRFQRGPRPTPAPGSSLASTAIIRLPGLSSSTIMSSIPLFSPGLSLLRSGLSIPR